MTGKKFTTLEEWTKFLNGKSVFIINENHPNYKAKCQFIEMVGLNNEIAHHSNMDGQLIRMRVKTPEGRLILIKHNEFFVEPENKAFHFLK